MKGNELLEVAKRALAMLLSVNGFGCLIGEIAMESDVIEHLQDAIIKAQGR